MTNFKLNNINPAVLSGIQPLIRTAPDRASVIAAINRFNNTGVQEIANAPMVFYTMPFIVPANGPVIEDGAAVFSDRNGNGQWVLPRFTLKDPLNGGFTFACKTDGKTSDSSGSIIDNYTGTITINLDNDLPAPGTDAAAEGDKVIPLENLKVTMNFQLANNQVLTYQPVATLADKLCTLTFNAGDLAVLTNLYKIFSDPASAPFCTLVIQASYWGFKKREAPPTLIKFRNLIRLNQGTALKARLRQPALGTSFFTNRRILKTIAPFEDPQINDLPEPQPEIVPEITDPPVVVENNNEVPEPQPEPAPEVIPPVDDTPKFDQVDNIPFMATIPVNFDCAKYPNNYLLVEGDTQTVFGCNPPFDTSIIRKHTYAPFSILTGSLAEKHYGINAIYRNQLNNNYLIVPEQYLIVLEDPSDTGQLVPSAYLNTTIDINDANGVNQSTASFKFNVAPNLSAWQLVKIKELILRNLPQNLGKTINDIYLEYPQALDTAQTQQLFNGHNIPVVQAVNLGSITSKAENINTFRIEFKQVPINDGTAATIAGSLKTIGAELIDKLVWQIDAPAGTNVQSAVVLSLFQVTGEALRYTVDLSTNGSYLSNSSLYDIAINSYVNNGTDTEVSPYVTIGGNNTVAIASLSFGQAINNISNLSYSYKANAGYVKQILKELRFNADEVDDDIIVTNNTGLFTRFNIKQIDFFISITKTGDTDPENILATATKTLTQDGAINHIPFVLPVTTYLSDWSAIYYTIISFTNGTGPVTTDPVLINDINSIGKVINLTATSLELIN